MGACHPELHVECPGDVIYPDAGLHDAGSAEECEIHESCVTAPGPDQVCVPGGVFMMGNDDVEESAPSHAVYVSAFWMDRTEITVSKYRVCVGAGYCDLPTDEWGLAYFRNVENDSKPMLFVTVDDMKEYCGWTRSRLPTEAEWERAARGDDGRALPWGSAMGCEFANWADCIGQAAPVGSYPRGASPFGILDLIGNAREATSDEYVPGGYDAYYPPLPVCDPAFVYRSLPGTAYASRGCSWRGNMAECLATWRAGGAFGDYGTVSDDLGFRCVREGR